MTTSFLSNGESHTYGNRRGATLGVIDSWGKEIEKEVRVAEALKSPPEGRVTLRNVSWETYERLLEADPGRAAPRFFYDRGVLEIVSPSARHESLSRLIATLIGELAVELEIDVFDAGSTTFRRNDLDGGFEADGSFCFSENASGVRGKPKIDLDAGDPPPDLVVEVDITSPSTSKLPIFARLGVPEVWRHDGERLTTLGLMRTESGDERYAEVHVSALLAPAWVTGEARERLAEEGLASDRPTWVRKVREWARDPR